MGAPWLQGSGPAPHGAPTIVADGHVATVRFPPLERVPEQARGVGQLVVLAVGEDEEPLTLVGAPTSAAVKRPAARR